jgi:molecular chaperone DnaJ
VTRAAPTKIHFTMAKEDFYELLGVAKGVNAEDLKKAYRKKAVQYHPDKNPGNKEAEEMFKKISHAYEVLQDADKRAAYDRYGHAAFEGPGAGAGQRGPGGGGGGFHDPFDIFREVFGGAGGGGGGGGIFDEMFSGGGRDGGRDGADLRYDLEITLEDAARGVEKEISFRKNVSCERCEGSGAEPGSKRVTCPTCRGAGQIRRSGGIITFTQACPTCGGAGTKVEKACTACRGEGRVPKSTKINVRIPPGVDSGARLRSSGNGEAGLAGGASGDLYIVLTVKDHEIFAQDSGLHPERHNLPPAWQGHALAPRRRPRRSIGARARRGPGFADQRTAQDPRGIRKDQRRRRRAGGEELFRQGQEILLSGTNHRPRIGADKPELEPRNTRNTRKLIRGVVPFRVFCVFRGDHSGFALIRLIRGHSQATA